MVPNNLIQTIVLWSFGDAGGADANMTVLKQLEHASHAIADTASVIEHISVSLLDSVIALVCVMILLVSLYFAFIRFVGYLQMTFGNKMTAANRAVLLARRSAATPRFHVLREARRLPPTDDAGHRNAFLMYVQIANAEEDRDLDPRDIIDTMCRMFKSGFWNPATFAMNFATQVDNDIRTNFGFRERFKPVQGSDPEIMARNERRRRRMDETIYDWKILASDYAETLDTDLNEVRPFRLCLWFAAIIFCVVTMVSLGITLVTMECDGYAGRSYRRVFGPSEGSCEGLVHLCLSKLSFLEIAGPFNTVGHRHCMISVESMGCCHPEKHVQSYSYFSPYFQYLENYGTTSSMELVSAAGSGLQGPIAYVMYQIRSLLRPANIVFDGLL